MLLAAFNCAAKRYASGNAICAIPNLAEGI